jgi:hypothetical protein
VVRTTLTRGILLSLLATLVGSSWVHATEGDLTILKPIEFGEDALVRDAVRAECQLQTRLPDFIAEYAKKHIQNIAFSDSVSDKTPGRVLIVKITDVTETGNAWTGRSSALTIRAELREDGKVTGTFRSRRSTQGGAFGGYKGSCAFLGRCAKTLGMDIAKWLENPVMDATGSAR